MTPITRLKKLIRQAHANPKKRQALLPKIMGMLANGKTAFGEESVAFTAWALARRKKVGESQVQKFFEQLGMELVEAKDRPKAKRGKLTVGESVVVKAIENTNELNSEVCDKYDKEYGNVEAVDSEGVAVRFDDGQIVRFDGTKPGKAMGLYRGSPVQEPEEGRRMPLVEFIYIRDKNANPPSKSRTQEIIEYVEKGEIKGEKRNRIYYSGMPMKLSTNKAGQVYCSIRAAQREMGWVSINPAKGELLYLGKLGNRPGGWKSDWEKMEAEAAEG
jgi:hypothetical protein